MEESKINQLNEFATAFGLENRVRFYGKDLWEVVKSVAPFSRVAVLYSKNSFLREGADFTATLKKAGVKPLNFIMPLSVTVKLGDVLDVIAVPEDVRAIVTFDRELVPIAAYLATVFGVPVVYGMISCNADSVIPAKIPFTFGGAGVETVAVSCNYHIAVNCEGDNGAAEGLVSLVTKRVALFDYRVKMKILNKKTKKSLCDEIESATKIAFTDENSLPSPEEIAFCGLKAELADFVLGGEITYNSAFYSFRRLTGFTLEAGVTFAFLQKLTALYRIVAENADMPFDIPDYNARTAELCKVTETDDGVFLKGFKEQKKALKAADLSAVKTAVKKEIALLSSLIEKAEKTYGLLGGSVCEDFSPYAFAIKYCGDLPETLNFTTVARECGFLEFGDR